LRLCSRAPRTSIIFSSGIRHPRVQVTHIEWPVRVSNPATGTLQEHLKK